MGLIQIDISQVAELGTQVAMHGAARAGEVAADDVFELIVSLVSVVIEMVPGG
ncbi:hypothetical protein [Sphingomonas sp. G-3-2-10]|jgi:hypothetical protein|uniref:hypothetical protein n=1 Tax=Sphingomonas sp. G-3-2-10 TaxID=2728838 RepID=UPI00146E9BDD|nr:hypothetical protein [Sphingomonas sp. G-3-2-10]NML07757.1 hypothetical protein [Sphingomonas sp. G-3-2-10]